jgi:hypothetical protein
MKTCVISGDLLSGSVAAQNPIVNLCDDCVTDDGQQNGQLVIREELEYQPDRGEACKWCGITAEEEAQAWAE